MSIVCFHLSKNLDWIFGIWNNWILNYICYIGNTLDNSLKPPPKKALEAQTRAGAFQKKPLRHFHVYFCPMPTKYICLMYSLCPRTISKNNCSVNGNIKQNLLPHRTKKNVNIYWRHSINSLSLAGEHLASSEAVAKWVPGTARGNNIWNLFSLVLWVKCGRFTPATFYI